MRSSTSPWDISRVVFFVSFAFGCGSASLAAGPGVPFGGCADWVVVKPGITCREAIPWPCQDAQGRPRAACGFAGDQPPWQGNQSQADNLGGVFAWRKYTNDNSRYRTELVQFDGEADELIAYIQEVQQPGFLWEQRIEELSLTFDEKHGRLYFAFQATCFSDGDPGCESGGHGAWLLGFDGFTTEFEVLQSYQPPPLGLSFRVPFMPEGMAAADWFDTYYGDLATVGDWSQAQPLQCRFPEAAPSTGDYLTVADSWPTPPPGGGYYFVTAATYQGQTRYGRRSSGGVLTGRDPAVLPACDQ